MNAVAIPREELAERLMVLAREARELANAFPEDGVDGPLGLMCAVTEQALREAHQVLSVEAYKWRRQVKVERDLTVHGHIAQPA
ncbi:MAG: hypothetical protein HY646_13790 [Acidobacteria bacterium]|nr:hypothetical protein [Acidobacteriota bacterium]